jgi:hypothetical protein
MADDVQLREPATVLLETSRRVVPGWLRRVTVAAGERGGVDVAVDAELEATVTRAAAGALDRLAELLATDVDDQRTTPLTVFRSAVGGPTEFLLARGARPPARTTAGGDAGDVFGLGPATWSDIDPDLHEPGLRWGAWKAMTVLGRRRDAGLR